MLWKELPPISSSRKICRDLSLETELSDTNLLKHIYSKTVGMIGLTKAQSISCDLFFQQMGEVILELAADGKINSQKIVQLSNKYSELELRLILGRTAVSLLEGYEIILGGPKIS